MTIVGIAALLISLAAAWFAARGRSGNEALLIISLLALHVAATLAFYSYSLDHTSDAYYYYYDPYGNWKGDFAFGTVVVARIVHYLRGTIGGSYLDYFLVFQTIGLTGLFLLWRAVEEIHEKLNVARTAVSYAIFFLPGVHFWTSAIGKDAPLFFGISLALWSMLRMPKRTIYLIVAMIVMVLFRPHIALITTFAIATAILLDSRTSFGLKALLLCIAVGATTLLVGTVSLSLKVDASNPNSVMDFVARTQANASQFGGGTSLAGSSFPVKLFSLLFRPLFIDAGGAFGFIASLENVVYLYIVGSMLLNYYSVYFLAKRVAFIRFSLVFALFLSVLLSLILYNVGLGSRQKIMIVPALFCVFVAQFALRRARQSVWIAPETTASASQA